MNKKIIASLTSSALIFLAANVFAAPQTTNQPSQMSPSHSSSQSFDSSSKNSSGSQSFRQADTNANTNANSTRSNFSNDNTRSNFSNDAGSSNIRTTIDHNRGDQIRANFRDSNFRDSNDSRWDRDNRDDGFRARFETNVHDHDHVYDNRFERNGRLDDTIIVRYRKIIQDDPALVTYAPNIDYIVCGDSIIVYGVVDSDQVKANIERRLKTVDSNVRVQNKLIIKK